MAAKFKVKSQVFLFKSSCEVGLVQFKMLRDLFCFIGNLLTLSKLFKTHYFTQERILEWFSLAQKIKK